MTLGVVMDHQCSETPVCDQAETRGIAASLWPAVEATAFNTCQDEARSNCHLVVYQMRSTPRVFWLWPSAHIDVAASLQPAVARCCGVTVCLQVRRRQQVIRLGSFAAAQVVYIVINTGPVHRKGLNCGPEASDGSYRSTAADQYCIAMAC